MEVTATKRERTDLTIEFNEALGTRCRRLGVDFIDLTDGLLDPATRLLRPEFVKPVVNQHLKAEQFADLISKRLSADESFRPSRTGKPPQTAGPSAERELPA
jgi:hypothetical protein